MYVKVNNGEIEKYPYSIGRLRKDNPDVSFPKNISDEVLADYGIYPVVETNPTVGENQRVEKSWTPELIDGVWTLNHQAVDLTQEEIDERDRVVGNNVREKRDSLLEETDWVVVKYTELGEAIPAEWTTYRQALRDITTHENFPYLNDDEDWPAKPVV